MYLKHLRNLVLVFAALAVVACGGKKEEQHEDHHAEETSAKEWKEMDDFHMVMAETFHPYKDSSNLAPAKAQASDLAASAATWASAPVPEKVDSDEMKGKLENLKNETAAFVQTANSGDDKAIGDQLTKIHDLFHEIQEKWYGGDGEHKHH